MRFLLPPLLLLLFVGGPAESPTPVKLLLADGTTLRANALNGHLELVTRFGKLRIPIAEIEKLGAESYTERDRASAELRAAGHFARPALRIAADSKDAEVSRRAKGLLAEIEATTARAIRGRPPGQPGRGQADPVSGRHAGRPGRRERPAVHDRQAVLRRRRGSRQALDPGRRAGVERNGGAPIGDYRVRIRTSSKGP